MVKYQHLWTYAHFVDASKQAMSDIMQFIKLRFTHRFKRNTDSRIPHHACATETTMNVELFMNIESLKKVIFERLDHLNPEKVILFGSHAWGEPSADSDIDLYIVTSDATTPATYHERSELYLRYAKAINAIIGTTPLDLIVHTRPMHQKFLKLDSMFSRKIIQSGISLL